MCADRPGLSLSRVPATSRRVAGPLAARTTLLAACTVLLAGTAGPSAADGASEVVETALVVPVGPEPTGEAVTLDVSVFAAGRPDEPRPAVVLAHGFGGSKDQLAQQARELATEGYVALTYTARGFGESGGRIHLNSPDYEIDDVARLLDLLAARKDVLLDGDGDPRVGIAGGSYGGAVALMAAGYDDRVDAIVPAITWNDLSHSLFAQGAQADGPVAPTPAASDPSGEPGVLKQRWAALLFASGLGGGDSPCGRFDPEVCALYGQAATTGRPSEPMLALLRSSSPAPVLERISAPTLLLQGEQDSLFPLDQADANARGIAAAGTPVSVRWLAGGHDAGDGSAATQEVTDAALAWFDHHLRGTGEDPGGFFTLALPPDPFEDADEAAVLRLRGYPGLDGDPGRGVRLPLTGTSQPVVSPAGGEPSALTGLPGTGGALAAAAAAGAGYPLAVLPGGAAVFDSAPVDATSTVVGSPRLRLSVTSSASDATLFASAWVVAPDGTATLARQLVSPVRLAGLRPGEPREVDVLLPASAYRLREGDRLRVVVSSTDQAYAVPTDARVYQVAVAGDGAVSVPVADAEEVSDALVGSGVPRWLLLGVPALALAAVAAALFSHSRRSRRRREPAEHLREAPLVVDGLVKAYANGFRAVDGVSWRAERGQVVGLLGPNGAGKTTTMRMLVGLVRPDNGTIHVLGERVGPGAPVLGRVGALIEGPGFLPHLSGTQNLQAYWAATGRPAHEAGLAEALAVADLGTAVDRPVRSYSQGMRQRLGIAQAMLGRPELLLLDEPTNGLDPPQILAMRGVLRDYAATGRTVVVSSHLLAEVEQTCSHVVVMHRGTVVLSGAVADLVAGEDTTVVLDGGDPTAAAALLRRVPGVVSATGGTGGRLHVVGDAARPRLVAALVAGGYEVSGVDGRRHLEDVFMRLIGEDATATRRVSP